VSGWIPFVSKSAATFFDIDIKELTGILFHFDLSGEGKRKTIIYEFAGLGL
jgi:hypothetical protein